MFTKGPWKIGVAGPNGCPTVGTVNGLMVCHVAHSINEDDQKSQALGNSRLIKAAPEMFEVIEALLLFTKPTKSNAVVLHKAHQLLAEIRGETA